MALLDASGREMVASRPAVGYSAGDMAELITEIRDLAEEHGLSESAAFSPQLLNLALEDMNWIKMGGSASGFDVVQSQDRAKIVQRARSFGVYDPLSVHTIRLWRIFTLGRGFKIKAKDERTQVVVDEFWKAPRNRSVFGIMGVRKNTNILNTDGELIFAVFTGKNGGGTTVRRLNTLEITEVVTDPEDSEKVWGYKREVTTKGGTPKKLFYWDMFLDPNDRPEFSEKDLNGFVVQPEGDGADDVVVHFTAANTNGQRGNSLLTPILDWSKAYRKFMEARHAIQMAMSRFVKKHNLPTTSRAAVANAVAFHQSGLVNGDTENNPPPAPGSTWVQAGGNDLTTIKQETGASNAQADGDMLLQMYGVGVGLPAHYLMSGKSAGNLSVATTMELPLLKQFEDEQQITESIYSDLIQFELEQANVPENKREVDIEFPPIVIEDIQAFMGAVEKIVVATPDLVGTDAITMLVLTALGVPDPTAALQTIKDDIEARPPVPTEVNEAAKVFTAVRDLTAKLREASDVA